MSILLQSAATWETMLADLRSRVGFHRTIGSADALTSILTEANEYVFDQLDDGLPWHSTLTVSANAQYTPFVTDAGLPIARGSVRSIWLEAGSLRLELPQGISDIQRGMALKAQPDRYDTTFTNDDPGAPAFALELWPVPEKAYKLYINHNRVIAKFAAPGDRPSAPARLVLAYAIAMGKAHYGKADAEVAGKAFQRMLTTEKEKQREGRRFLPRTMDPAPYPTLIVGSTGTVSAPSSGGLTPPPPSQPGTNNAPVNTVPSVALTVATGSTLAFSGTKTISVADVDGGVLTTIVSVTAGTLSVSTGTGATITGNGSASVTMVGTAAQINLSLAGLVYTPPSTAQTVAMTVTTSDGIASDTDVLSVAVTGASSAPAPQTIGKTEADVQTAIAAPTALWWYPQFQSDRAINPDGTGGPQTAGGGNYAYERDHKTGNAHPLVYASTATSMIWAATEGGMGIFNPTPSIAGMGGSTTGFLLCAAIRIDGGYYNTIMSDVNGAAAGAGAVKNGVYLRYSGDTPGLTLSAGTGSARVSVTDNKANLAGSGSSVFSVLCAWYDDTAHTLNLQINDRPIVSAACSGMSAGLSAMTFFTNPAADTSFSPTGAPDGLDQFFGIVNGLVLVKNSCLTAAQRDTLRFWMADQCGLTLTSTQSGLALPGGGSTGPAPAPSTSGTAPFVPFGSRPDLVAGNYPYGIAPTNYTQTQMDTRVKACYDAWKAARIFTAPTWTPTSGIYAGVSLAGTKFVGKTGGGGTFSEGMGYGMLITVVMAGYDAGAQAQFDALYKFCRGHNAFGMSSTSGSDVYLMDWNVNADHTSVGGGYPAHDGDMDIALALLMAHRQWGSSGTPIAVPVQASPTTATTGGTLAAGTYFYKVTAVTAAGETTGSNEQSISTTGATSANTINWGAVTGATGYRIYRGTAAGAENLYYSAAAGATSFVDTGAAGTAGTVPTTNTAVTPFINYYQQALNTINALKVLYSTNGLPWYQYSNVTRVSDFMFGHFRAYKKATQDSFWDTARTTCLSLMQTMTAQSPINATGLMPGFIYDPFGTDPVATRGPRPDTIKHIDGSGIEDKYDSNSVRIPWRLATDYITSGDAAIKALCSKIVTTIKTSSGGDPAQTSYAYQLDGTPMSGLYYAPDTGGCVGAGSMVDAAHQAYLNISFTDASITPQAGGVGFDAGEYYAAELQLLPLLVMSRNWWQP